MNEYVLRNEAGTLRVIGSRVTLASIVHCYWRGESPEEILQAFPTLTLEQIYGAITYYLANRGAVDGELGKLDARWEELRSEARQRNRELREKLHRARETSST